MKQHIHPGEKHRFTGLENSEIIEFSTHHIEEDSYRDEASGRVLDSMIASGIQTGFGDEWIKFGATSEHTVDGSFSDDIGIPAAIIPPLGAIVAIFGFFIFFPMRRSSLRPIAMAC